MTDDFLLLNGDTLFEDAVLALVLDQSSLRRLRSRWIASRATTTTT